MIAHISDGRGNWSLRIGELCRIPLREGTTQRDASMMAQQLRAILGMAPAPARPIPTNPLADVLTAARALTVAADLTISTSLSSAIAMLTDSIRLAHEYEEAAKEILVALKRSEDRTDVHPAPELEAEQSDGVPVPVLRETVEGGA